MIKKVLKEVISCHTQTV